LYRPEHSAAWLLRFQSKDFRVRIPPTSTGFTLLLGFLVALPSFGIDTSLPALIATGTALRVTPAEAGLMMSLFMLGFAVAPLVYGPASDRYGRKPVVLVACLLFTIAAIGCSIAYSLASLLVWRVVQGTGAGASMTIAFAIVRDLFEGQTARTKISHITMATMDARADGGRGTVRVRWLADYPRGPCWSWYLAVTGGAVWLQRKCDARSGESSGTVSYRA
jgi:hypothetical protein